MDNIRSFALYLEKYADKSEFYQLLINGKSCSFNGVRVFKSKGAAKTALHKHIKSSLHLFPYRHIYGNHTGQLKLAMDELHKSDLPDKPSTSEIHDIMDELFELGIVEIKKYES